MVYFHRLPNDPELSVLTEEQLTILYLAAGIMPNKQDLELSYANEQKKKRLDKSADNLTSFGIDPDIIEQLKRVT